MVIAQPSKMGCIALPIKTPYMYISSPILKSYNEYLCFCLMFSFKTTCFPATCVTTPFSKGVMATIMLSFGSI